MTRTEYADHMVKAPANFYYGVMWNKLYRRAIVEAHHLRCPDDVAWCEDFLFNLDYIACCRLIAAVPRSVYYYRKREDSLVNTQTTLRKVIRTALAAEGVDFPCEVDVSVSSDAGIRDINREMRQVDAPTDVLSFPAFDLAPGELPGPEDADPGTGLVPLGDMVISLERVQAQAKEFGHSNRRELAYLAVHSVLHLLGYDHLDEGPMKRQMRAREEAILGELGITREGP